MVKKIKFEINFSNRWLYTFIAIGILVVIGVGVYAYNSGGPASVVGHSAEELDLSGGVDGVAVFNEGINVNGAAIFNNGIKTDNVVLKTKVVEIGGWNMDMVDEVYVSHGLGIDYRKIRSVDIIVRDDDNGFYYLLNHYGNIDDPKLLSGGVRYISSTSIALVRRTNGYFDTGGTFGDFVDDTSYNRGWIHITYIA